jgi:methionyl-tRNA formyltransferase
VKFIIENIYNMKNVIVMGKGKLAIQISEWFKDSEKYNLIQIVSDMPEPDWDLSLGDWANKNGIPLIRSGDYTDCDLRNIDLCFSVFYGKIIKEDFIMACKNILNLHNSPLPKYRGVRPINWALKNNENHHGVTIHEITPGIDDGPIYGQIKYSIYPEIEEVGDVYAKALKYGWLLFQDVIDKVDEIVPQKQNGKGSYYSMKDSVMLGDRNGWRRK